MTFCFAVEVEEGLVGIADTRVTTGTQHIAARKLAIFISTTDTRCFS